MTEPTKTLLRMGDNLVVVKTDLPVEGEPRLYVASTMAQQIGASLNFAQVKMLHETLGDWLVGHRLETPGKTYDHDPVPDDMPEPGDRCKKCGEDITWIGPGTYDYLHVDDEENR